MGRRLLKRSTKSNVKPAAPQWRGLKLGLVSDVTPKGAERVKPAAPRWRGLKLL